MRNRIKVLTGMLVASSTFGVQAQIKYSDIAVKYVEKAFNNKIIRTEVSDRKVIMIVPSKGALSSQISAFKRRYRN